MLKKNKEMLKRIYEQEFAKAKAKEEKARLERQIANIKKKAREDAKRRYVRGKSLGKSLGKSMKKFSKRAKKIQRASEDLLYTDFKW